MYRDSLSIGYNADIRSDDARKWFGAGVVVVVVVCCCVHPHVPAGFYLLVSKPLKVGFCCCILLNRALSVTCLTSGHKVEEAREDGSGTLFDEKRTVPGGAVLACGALVGNPSSKSSGCGDGGGVKHTFEGISACPVKRKMFVVLLGICV